MALSEVQICNLALGWLGAELITSLLDDNEGAKLCNANFASARDAILEDANWSFAITRAVLTPMLEPPDHSWNNQFLIPARVIRLLTVTHNTTIPASATPWVKEGNKILANEERLYITYVARITDTALFTAQFTQVLAQRLAADLAIPITESRTLQESHWGLYEAKLENAITSDGLTGNAQEIQTYAASEVRNHGWT